MIRTITLPSSYIYVCTRLKTRATLLYPRDEYGRILNMSLPEIARFIGEGTYREEVMSLSGSASGIDLIEAALSRNLAESFRNIMRITPGYLHHLIAEYVNKWDIANVMTILRGKQHHIPDDTVSRVLIPAGVLDPAFLEHLLSRNSCEEIVEALRAWPLYPVLRTYYNMCEEKGAFARLENALYKEFYYNLINDAVVGVKGGEILARYVRFEIDITNLRNLLRLRCGESRCERGMIEENVIPDGDIPIGFFEKLYTLDDRDQFAAMFKKTNILPVLTAALRQLQKNPLIDEDDAIELVWDRFQTRERAVHEVEIAVAAVRLHLLEKLSKRFPFSVLPILSYLEHKKYEVFNLRAIARGKEFGIPSERIQTFLVL